MWVNAWLCLRVKSCVWECKWIYGYVTVCVSEHAHCVYMWIHFCMWLCSYASEKCDKWLCFYTHTHHTYECISVSLCMHVDVLEKTFEHVQVSIVECVSVCDCVCVWVNVQLCWCASEPMSIFICVSVSLYTYEWMCEHVPMWMWVGKNLDMFVCEHVWMWVSSCIWMSNHVWICVYVWVNEWFWVCSCEWVHMWGCLYVLICNCDWIRVCVCLCFCLLAFFFRTRC